MNAQPDPREMIQLVRGLFVITDPGRDQDDEDTLVILNRMIRLNLLDLFGVVANLKPSHIRARLAKGTLNVLGPEGVPVGFGSGNVMTDDDDLSYEFQVGYLAPPEQVVDGQRLIIDTLEQAPKGGIILTLISQLTDAAEVLFDYKELFREKVRRVVIMGGVLEEGGLPKLEDGMLIPDLSAQNHAFDRPAAQYLYNQLQRKGIPMTILSRHAAAAAKVPRTVYEAMAKTGHPVGIRLHDAQRHAIEELWRRANLAANDPARKGLPERCNKTWFSQTFCAGAGLDRTGNDPIWDLVQSFILYDPCTLIAAMPGLREYFFSPYVHELSGAEHMVIGLSTTRHGVARPAELAEYLQNALLSSLQMSLADGQQQTG